MLVGPPGSIREILRSANSRTPNPRLGLVLESFRKQWLALGHRLYPHLGDDLQDAVQTALMKLVATEKLETLHEADRLEAWARSLFVRAVLDLARHEWRHSRRRTYVGTAEDDPEHALRDALPDSGPSPEDLASHRERLAIVARVVSRLEIARLKFVEDLPEKEIATSQGLTRFAVAGRLKRVRVALGKALEAPEYHEGGRGRDHELREKAPSTAAGTPGGAARTSRSVAADALPTDGVTVAAKPRMR
jgi:RNA polymerase sigma factor (sigma-70 family)